MAQHRGREGVNVSTLSGDVACAVARRVKTDCVLGRHRGRPVTAFWASFWKYFQMCLELALRQLCINFGTM